MEVSVNLHTPAALTPEKILRCPYDKGLGGLQCRRGRYGEENIFDLIPRLDLRPLLPSIKHNYNEKVNIQLYI
jgi:hypothetical protein